MSSLSPTARVILGMLKLGVRTGYDIKKAIDLSTQFFWGASYGQIYPDSSACEKPAWSGPLTTARQGEAHRVHAHESR